MTKMMKNDEEEEEAVRKAMMSDTVHVHVHFSPNLSFLWCCCHDHYYSSRGKFHQYASKDDIFFSSSLK